MSDIFEEMQQMFQRINTMESHLYGDERSLEPGLLREVNQLAEQVGRQIFVTWVLIAVTFLDLAAIAIAVLIPWMN